MDALFVFGGFAMKKVDKLGRIVIPSALREKYGLTEGSAIEFIDTGDGIAVQSSQSLCKICHSKIAENSAMPLCKACIKKAIKSYNENK